MPGAHFLEKCRCKQNAARCHLSGSGWSSLLKPPGDSLNKHRGHQVWHKISSESEYKLIVGKLLVGNMPVPMRDGHDHVSQRCPHLPHKPGTSLIAKQRSIEPFVLRDMLEE